MVSAISMYKNLKLIFCKPCMRNFSQSSTQNLHILTKVANKLTKNIYLANLIPKK